mmetsp:Transcript_325/g.703  ORF Transcript_325/g.703 Transcript_325/m.703 type:complete len:107 (-) Transcript_325:1038-1358(-)
MRTKVLFPTKGVFSVRKSCSHWFLVYQNLSILGEYYQYPPSGTSSALGTFPNGATSAYNTDSSTHGTTSSDNTPCPGINLPNLFVLSTYTKPPLSPFQLHPQGHQT